MFDGKESYRVNGLLIVCYKICCVYDGVDEWVRRYEGMRKNRWNGNRIMPKFYIFFIFVLVYFHFFFLLRLHSYYFIILFNSFLYCFNL
jgi:hypothetical protein